jgi:hypothetical protein
MSPELQLCTRTIEFGAAAAARLGRWSRRLPAYGDPGQSAGPAKSGSFERGIRLARALTANCALNR